MTYGKLREILESMSDNQLKQNVTVLVRENGIVIDIEDVRILNDEKKNRRYPALVA